MLKGQLRHLGEHKGVVISEESWVLYLPLDPCLKDFVDILGGPGQV